MNQMGPFGLWMGMTAAEVQAPLDEIAPYKYRTDTVPKPHSAFDTYVLEITPQNGLAWVKAIGRTVDTNSFGTQLITAFESMESKLAPRYGPSDRADFLLPGSIWDEPRDWMTALEAKDRMLMTVWSPEHGSTLPYPISTVALVATALDTSSGFIAVEYSFQNLDAAEAEIAALEDDVL